MARNPAFLSLMRRADDKHGGKGRLYADAVAMADKAREQARLQGGAGRGGDDDGKRCVGYDKAAAEAVLTAASATVALFLRLFPPLLACALISSGMGFVIGATAALEGIFESDSDDAEFFDAEEGSDGSDGGDEDGGSDAGGRLFPRDLALPSPKKCLEIAGKIIPRVIAVMFVGAVVGGVCGRSRERRQRREEEDEVERRRRSYGDSVWPWIKFEDSVEKRRLALQ